MLKCQRLRDVYIQDDILTHLLLAWEKEDIHEERLHAIWAVFLQSLYKKGVEMGEFYIGTVGHYPELTHAIYNLTSKGLISDFHQGKFKFTVTQETHAALEESVPSLFLEAVREVAPIILRLYDRSLSTKEALQILRTLRKETKTTPT